MKRFKSILPLFFVWLLFSPATLFAQNTIAVDFADSFEESALPNELTLLIKKTKYSATKTDMLGWTEEKSELKFNPAYFSEIENINFCPYASSFACRLSFSYKNQIHIEKTSVLEINRSALENFVKDLARSSDKDPENAKLKIENGKVSTFSLSSPGVKLDIKKSVEVLEKYLLGGNRPAELALPFAEVQPEISIDSIDNLGITELIGEGKSNFKGSPKNRIFNIKVATNRFNGLLIKPGEEFSFVKNLGEVDGEHGYLPELVIKKDKTEPEFGGGICQVSTTAFRAAIYSGLEITARRNHAYPVGYYNPQGMDATVYVPRPDLRFINDTPGHILIQTKIEGTELIFAFYGTSDGRKTKLIGPTILEKNPDGSMKATFTQQIFDQDEKLLRENIFNSAYDSPSKYPHPASSADILTEKPKDWSNNEWRDYKKEHNL